MLAAIHAELARSDAGLVLVQLDDLSRAARFGQPAGDEHRTTELEPPHERHLEQIVDDPAVHDAFAPLQEHRGRISSGSVGRLARGAETVLGVSLLDSIDVHLFNEGRHFRLYEKLGSHPMTVGGVSGVLFAVWAPNAERVAVVGDFNGWNGMRHPLSPHADSGVWEGFVPGVTVGTRYRFPAVRGSVAVSSTRPIRTRYQVRSLQRPPRSSSSHATSGSMANSAHLR